MARRMYAGSKLDMPLRLLDSHSHDVPSQRQRHLRPACLPICQLRILIVACCINATLGFLEEPRPIKSIAFAADRVHRLADSLKLMGDAAEKAVSQPASRTSPVVLSRLPHLLKAASQAASALEAPLLAEAQAVETQEVKLLRQSLTAHAGPNHSVLASIKAAQDVARQALVGEQHAQEEEKAAKAETQELRVEMARQTQEILKQKAELAKFKAEGKTAAEIKESNEEQERQEADAKVQSAQRQAELEKQKLDEATDDFAAAKRRLEAQSRSSEMASQLAIQNMRKEEIEKVSKAEAQSSQAQKKLEEVEARAQQDLAFQSARSLKSLKRFISGPLPEEVHGHAHEHSSDDIDGSMRYLLMARDDVGLATEYSDADARAMDLDARNTELKHILAKGGWLEKPSFRKTRGDVAYQKGGHLIPNVPRVEHNSEDSQDLDIGAMLDRAAGLESASKTQLPEHPSNDKSQHQAAETKQEMEAADSSDDNDAALAEKANDDSDPAFGALLRAQATLSTVKLR